MIRNQKLYTLAALSLLIAGSVSCSNEETLIPNAGDGGNVVIRTSLPVEMATRAFGDASGPKKLCYAVYNEGSATPISGMTVDGANAIDMPGLSATVSLKLVTGRTYDIIFWAESEGAHEAATKPYTLNWNGRTVDVDYSALLSNDEDRDAFFVKHTIRVDGPVNEEITLRRPFAQVNFGTDDLSEKSVVDAYGADLKTALSTTVYKTLDLTTGAVSNPTAVTFGFAPIPEGETFPTIAGNTTSYDYVSMNYLLVGADRSIADLKFEISNADGVIHTLNVSAAPVQRNYRTNIFGSLLTSNADFKVTIDPVFNEPSNDVEVTP